MSEYKSIQTITTVETLLHKLSKGQINTEPEYQRDVVWDDERQIKFIDSIMKGIVPMPIILCKNKKEDGHICIDGKQRLTSIRRYKENKIQWDDRYYDDLEKDEEFRFSNSNIHVIEYGSLDYGNQKEIFSRIQYGKALSQGEKLMSLFDQDSASRFKKMCDTFFEDYLHNYKKIKKEKAEHFLFVSSVIILMKSGNNKDLTDKKKIENLLENINKKEEDELTKLMNIAFSVNLLLNKDVLTMYKKIEPNRLIIVLNEIYKEMKTFDFKNNKATKEKEKEKEKYNELRKVIMDYFDRVNKKVSKRKKM